MKLRLLQMFFVICLAILPVYPQSGTRAWVQVLEVKGSATKQTDLFETKGSKWRVRWEKPARENYLTITVYGKEGDPIDVISTKSTTNDESYIHKPGRFYLSINASDSYTIIVEDWR